MTFEQLLQDKIFDLPIDQPKSKQFDQFIGEFLDTFMDKVESLDDGVLAFEDRTFNTDFIKEAHRVVISGLKKSIKNYYNGSPYQAYESLNEALRGEVKDLYQVMKQVEYPIDSNFYRIREREENYPYSPKEMFHIPFELRGKVTSQRFSIPGFPSLYLGRSLYICWEELNRPQFSKIQAARLQSTRKIRLLDLTPTSITNPNSFEAYKYFMTFPLIACCSVKVKDYSNTFKPEYIIPQLLLQWIRQNDQLDGIRYNSTHISKRIYKVQGEYANIVIPVKKNAHTGHCKQLKSMFKMTETISAQLHQFALGGQIFLHSREHWKILDSRVPEVEIIKGRSLPYSFSVLGSIEGYLDGMPTSNFK